MRLRIWLPRLVEVRGDARVRYDVLGTDRQIQQRSETSIASLPTGVKCEVVLHALDTVLLDVQPPKLTGARLAAALRALVEDRIAVDIDRVHAAGSARGLDGRMVVAVTDRAALRRALDVIARGRRVVSATPRPLTLPFVVNRWRAQLEPDHGCIRTGPLAGTGFATSDEPPVELALLLGQAVEPPVGIDVEGPCDTGAWSRALGVPVAPISAATHASPVVLELLQHEFTPRARAGKAERLTAVLAFALLVIVIGGLNLQAWRLRSEARDLRARMTRTVQDAFPQVSVVLDPVAQMQRMVGDLRPSGDDGFFLLATRFGLLADADSVQSIEYGAGGLSVTFRNPPLPEATRAALAARAAKEGLALRFEGDTARFVPQDRP